MRNEDPFIRTYDKNMIGDVLDFFHFGNTLNGNGGGGGDELTTLKKKKMRRYGKF